MAFFFTSWELGCPIRRQCHWGLPFSPVRTMWKACPDSAALDLLGVQGSDPGYCLLTWSSPWLVILGWRQTCLVTMDFSDDLDSWWTLDTIPKSALLDLLQYCDIVPWPAAQAIPLRSRLPISLGAASCCCSLTPISLCFLGCFCRGTSKNILQEVCVSSAAAYQLVCTGFPGPTHWRHESIQASSG